MASDNIKPNALDINFTALPEEICISTMTITGKLDTEFNVINIGTYIDITPSDIICVKYGHIDDLSTNRFIDRRRILQKNKKKKKSFYNQVTLIVRTFNNKTNNVKLFSNGSIQMTGCKNIASIEDVLTKVFYYLGKTYAIWDSSSQKFIDKPFVTNLTALYLNQLYNLKICMINSNFNIDFKIDRGKLYDILLTDKYDCTFDPIIHACVNIKYNNPEKIISIFVFESGSIIITGARNSLQIIDAYNFINKYLLSHYFTIVKDDGLSDRIIEEISMS
jgi:TATA-box binding protein (TBP) (component of TFIID and TFIIIB)